MSATSCTCHRYTTVGGRGGTMRTQHKPVIKYMCKYTQVQSSSSFYILCMYYVVIILLYMYPKELILFTICLYKGLYISKIMTSYALDTS